MEYVDSPSALLKLLSHPARIAILDILRQDEACVCHLEAHLGMRQAYISQQLAILRQAGLVSDRRDGWNIYYRVADAGVFALLDVARNLTRTPAPMILPQDCPCPKCATRDSG